MPPQDRIEALLDDVGVHEGRDGIESIARDGYKGDVPPETMRALLAAHGTAGEALYAIQLRAMLRVSCFALDDEHA